MSLPYFPMFPSDFEAKTSHLTLAEDGAYNRLLRICWMTPGCSIPADEAWIMRRVRAFTEADKEAVRAVLGEFFTAQNGRYSNAKMTRIWLEANEAHEKRKSAGSKGGKAKALKTNDLGSGNAKAMPKQPEPEPEPLEDTNVSSLSRSKPAPKTERFQEFWDQYPHRGGAKKGRSKAEAKYARLVGSGTAEQEIIAGAIRYATDRGVVDGYAKNPETWLNNRGWEDDIEPIPLRSINGANYDNSPTGRAQSGPSNFNHSSRPGSGTTEAFATVAAERSWRAN